MGADLLAQDLAAPALQRGADGLLDVVQLQRLVDLTSAGPARVHDIAGKGRLAVGWDADLVLVDLSARHTVTDEEMASRCGWTPFHGRRVCGWPVATVIRGNLVMREGALVGAPVGAPVRFGGLSAVG